MMSGRDKRLAFGLQKRPISPLTCLTIGAGWQAGGALTATTGSFRADPRDCGRPSPSNAKPSVPALRHYAVRRRRFVKSYGRKASPVNDDPRIDIRRVAFAPGNVRLIDEQFQFAANFVASEIMGNGLLHRHRCSIT